MLSSRNEERRKHKGYGILERENITEVGQIQLDKPIALSNDSIPFPLSPTNYPTRQKRNTWSREGTFEDPRKKRGMAKTSSVNSAKKVSWSIATNRREFLNSSPIEREGEKTFSQKHKRTHNSRLSEFASYPFSGWLGVITRTIHALHPLSWMQRGSARLQFEPFPTTLVGPATF